MNYDVADPTILCHPNIPKPLHGVAPRVIAGNRWWDEQRKLAYERAQFRCQACGTPKADVLGVRKLLEAHEFYDYDYEHGRLTFKKLVALCPYCHAFIHSGRTENLYNTEAISYEVYAAIMNHGHSVLQANGLSARYEMRHNSDWQIAWQDWRMVFEGKEYGPSSRSMDDWLDGAWKNWRPT